MDRSLRHTLPCIAILFLITSLTLWAQVTGTLEGRIIDPDGRPLQGAIIRIVGTHQGAVSKLDGNFRVAGIRAGDYDIKISRLGYGDVTTHVRIRVGETTSLSQRFASSHNTLNLTFRSNDNNISVPYSGIVTPGKDIHVRVFRVIDPTDFFLSHRDIFLAHTKHGQTLSGGDRMAALENRAVFRFVKEWDHTPAMVLVNNMVNETIPLRIRKPGVYMVEVAYSPDQSMKLLATVVISDLAIITKQGDDGTLAYVVNALTGRREPDVELTYGCDTSSIKRTTTRWDGTARLTLDFDCAFLPLVMGTRRGEIIIAELPTRSSSEESLVLHLQTDRPLYRPGQLVYYRGIGRWPDGNGGYRKLTESEATVAVRDAQGKVVSQGKHKLSDLGTFSGDLCLGAECPLGRYTATVTLGKTTTSFEFEVAEYKKPEYEVTMSTPQQHYIEGETIKATVKGRYFFGAPVAWGEVEYMIIRAPLQHGGAATNFMGAASEEVIHTAKGRMQGDGTFTIDYPIGASLPNDYSYRIMATVTDASRRAITGTVDVTVAKSEYAVAVGLEKNFYRVGDVAKVLLAVSRYDRRDAAAVRYTITATRRIEERSGDTTIEQRERIWTTTGVTDAAGRATIPYKVTREGSIELRAEVAGERLASGGVEVMAINEQDEGCEIYCRSVVAIPELKSYTTGQAVDLLVILPEESVDLLVTSEAKSIISHEVKRIGGRKAIVSVPLTRSHAPNFVLTVASVTHGKHYSQNVPIRVLSTERTMLLEIAAAMRSFAPGDSTTITLRALDRTGAPLRNADLALAVVDESIFALASDATPSLQELAAPRRTHAIASTCTHTTSFPLLMRGFGSSDIVLRANRVNVQEIVVTSASVQQSMSGATRSGVSIRGGRQNETALRVDGLETGDQFEQAQQVNSLKTGRAAELVHAHQVMPGYIEPKLRTAFKDMIAWSPSLRTDAEGYARLGVRFPDNLTTWRVTARGITEATEVGEARENLLVKKDLLVRMETPRFVTQGDSLLVATTIHNYLSTPKRVTVRLTGENAAIGAMERTITVGPNDDARIDWPVSVTTADSVTLRAKALTDEESDAVETSFPVIPRGLYGKVSAIGNLAPGERSSTISLTIPAESAGDTRSLTVMLSPSLGSSMIGALDDLIGYAYGCAEQSMSRFLPTVVVANTLKELRLPFDAAKQAELPKMVQTGLQRLYSYQHSDGGWGWWENDATNPFMTAYIMYGLTIARQAGYTIPEERYSRGLASIRAQLERGMPGGKVSAQAGIDEATLAYMLYVASMTGVERGDRFYRDRIAALATSKTEHTYASALLALAARNHGDTPLADSFTPLLVDLLEQSKDGHIASATHTGRWQADPVEATSSAISAVIAARGNEDAVNKGVTWLVAQRQGSSWRSTRQTAMAIYALSDYLRVNAQSGSDYNIIVKLNGEPIYTRRIAKLEALGEALRVTVRGEKILPGRNSITIEKEGDGRLQASAWAEYYTDGAEVRPFNAGFDVTREYYTLHREQRNGRYIYLKKPFDGTVKSGDELLVKVTISTDTERDYFLLEDPLPAGCEVMTDVTGYTIEGEDEYRALGLPADGRWRWWYSSRDLRDEKIAFFATKLGVGKHRFSYLLRAQIPGRYGVMPSIAMLNYFPEVHGNSEALQMMILE